MYITVYIYTWTKIREHLINANFGTLPIFLFISPDKSIRFMSVAQLHMLICVHDNSKRHPKILFKHGTPVFGSGEEPDFNVTLNL